MRKSTEKEFARGLFGIELNLDTIILIALWALGYKIAFWIILVCFILNACARASIIQKM